MKKHFLLQALFVLGGLLPLAASASVTINVLNDQLMPVADANVLVGNSGGTPFMDNWGKTDASGQITFNQIDQVTQMPITIAKPGYPKITYFNQSGTQLTLRLPPILPTKIVDVSGKVVNWQSRPPEVLAKLLDFGFFLPFMSLEKIFNLQLSDLMGGQPDKMTVFGRTFYVPSNLALPKQSVNYMGFPISFEKAKYRLSVGTPSTQSFVMIAGKAPFDKILQDMQNNMPLIDSINDLDLQRFGIQSNQTITGPVSNLDIDINKNKLAPCLSISATNVPNSLHMLSVAMVRDASGRLFQPTDLKKTTSQAVTTKCVANDTKPVSVVNLGVSYRTENDILIIDKGITMIFAKDIQRNAPSIKLSVDSFFGVPQIQTSDERHVRTTSPEVPGISPSPLAVYAVLSSVSSQLIGNFIVEDVKPNWVVFGDQNMTDITLPQLPWTLEMDEVTTKKRWEVTWLGTDAEYLFSQQNLVSTNLGYEMFELATHAARNSVDF